MNTKFFSLFLVFLFFLVINLESVIADPCPAGKTFVSKTSYNICYSPNFTDVGTNSFNITDKNNITLLRYNTETHTDINNTLNRNYKVNFSEVYTYNGTEYIYYTGIAPDNNQTTKGIMYLKEDHIYNVIEKDLFANFTGSMRQVWDNFYIASYQRMNNGTITTNNVGGSNALITAYNTIKQIGRSEIITNFTISGQYYTMILNKTYERSLPNNHGLNTSISAWINATDVFTSNQGGMNEIRANNQTFIRNGIVVQQDTNNLFTRYGIGYIISFNESHFTVGSELSNNTINQVYEGMTGFQYYDDSCATGFSTRLHSCTPFRLRSLISTNYLNKILQNSFIEKLGNMKNIHLSLLFLNETNDLNRSFGQDYSFDPITDQNYLNNTHTRLVGDSLIFLINKADKDQSVNQTTAFFINHLQKAYYLNNGSNTPTITHSTGDKPFVDRYFVINTHTIGTNALLIANLSGKNVNTTLLDQYISTAISAYPLMFNESRGNSSYYAVSGDQEYFNVPSYGNSIYITLEMQDYLNFYQYTKNETAHLIFQRKLSELRSYFNTSGYDCPANTCGDLTGLGAEGKTKGYYQNLSTLAFTQNSQLDITDNLEITPYYGWNDIPNGLQFTTIYHPIYFAKDNRTFFIDSIDGLKFVTPVHAMIPDFKYDSSLKGMTIYNKWAFNVVNGNFTNLSTTPYNYFYSPQHAKFINYREVLNWTATSNTETMWTGNITTSTEMLLTEGVGNKFVVDDVVMGDSNNTLYFSASTPTSKTITSNLSETINATVIVDVSQCSFNAEYEGENVEPTSCSNNQATFNLNGIPAGNSELVISYVSLSCEADVAVGSTLIQVFSALAIVIIALSLIVWRNEIFETAGVGGFIAGFIAIIVGLTLFTTIAQNLGTACL